LYPIEETIEYNFGQVDIKQDLEDYTTEAELNMLLEAFKPARDYVVIFKELL